MQASSNGNINATFAIAYFYQEGKHIKRDIKKAIHNYEIASSFNNQYAKNNLGIICKNGVENEIQKNIEFAIIYFDENIKRSNDKISMYNLAHIYICVDQSKEMIDKSIDLLINSINQNLLLAEFLLCVALIKKHGLNFSNIYKEIKMKTEKTSRLSDEIFEIIDLTGIYSMEAFNQFYKAISMFDVKYNFLRNPIFSFEVFNIESKIEKTNNKKKNITKDFYEGFGI